MNQELIRKKARNEFREYLVKLSLRKIASEFEAEGIKKVSDYTPPEKGARHSLVEQYYKSLDFTEWSDVRKLLNVYEDIILQIPEDNERDKKNLCKWLKKDGFTYHGSRIYSLAIPSEIRPIISRKSERETAKLWGPEYLRVFLSHKANVKKATVRLKEELSSFGISCFVAHEDIAPTKEWQYEIEKALFSMEAMIVLLTKGFSDSDWIDQEVGVAIGRGVPVIPVRFADDPYGFIGKYQAVAGNGKKIGQLAKELFQLLFSKPNLKGRIAEALVARFEKSQSFNHANLLMTFLETIDVATPVLIKRLERAKEKNTQVEEAWRVKRDLPGLLKKLKGKK